MWMPLDCESDSDNNEDSVVCLQKRAKAAHRFVVRVQRT